MFILLPDKSCGRHMFFSLFSPGVSLVLSALQVLLGVLGKHAEERFVSTMLLGKQVLHPPSLCTALRPRYALSSASALVLIVMCGCPSPGSPYTSERWQMSSTRTYTQPEYMYLSCLYCALYQA